MLTYSHNDLLCLFVICHFYHVASNCSFMDFNKLLW